MKNPKGFTLIELLIVILIISIVAGIATITISSNQRRQFESNAKQIANIISLAEEEALLRPATLGLLVSGNSLEFFEYQHDKWQPLTQPPLNRRQYSNSTQLSVKLQEEAPPKNRPQIIIPPTGDLTPFIIFIGKKNAAPYYKIIGKANGEVRSEQIDEK